MRSRLDVQDNDDLLDGADVRDYATEPDDDTEPLRARQDSRAAVRGVREVREHEQPRRRHPVARRR